MRTAMTLIMLLFASLAQAQTYWTVKSETDPMTDKLVVTATAEAHPSADYIYQLELRCDSRNGRRVTIGSYTSTGQTRPMPFTSTFPRIPFSDRTDYSRTIDVLSFRYRVDDSPPREYASLTARDYVNVGQVFMEFPAKLPTTRVLVADIFPDETVEFSFTNLSVNDRAVLMQECFK